MPNELLKRVRKIEIRSRRLSSQIFAGEYHSLFKGRGIAFSEVREYQFGDDVRDMDWNVTARLNTPYIKIFEEERELTVMLLIDLSGSTAFGANQKSKKELMAEISAVLAFSANANNDKVGALFFSSKVEKFIPPKKGRSHLLMIIRELLYFRPEERGTNISTALQFLTNALKKRATVFLISDMLDLDEKHQPNYEEALKIATGRHDLYLISLYDKLERELPNVGLIKVFDSERGEEIWVDSSKKSVREHYREWNRQVVESRRGVMRKYRVDQVEIATHEDYVKGLISLFKQV